ncbi:MAG: MBL fold metallo-hydrolase [Desulfovibrio sp.]|nr:MBL fold metallo-hydrolase [Desulfovibrio sp.]
MKVQLLGAAQTVTGSCCILETEHARFAVDCGMHQGNAEIEKRNCNTRVYQAAKLDFILLTHAHIDHSGLLPRMMRENFDGLVYCTEPTVDLVSLMLEDSAYIQEMEAEWANRKRARRGKEDPVEALYTLEEARAVLSRLRPTRYGEAFEPAPGVRVCYRDAGHILGSSFLEIEISENGALTRLLFSGDLGRPGALLMNAPAQPAMPVDYLFMESTYGDRNHRNEDSSRDELADAIRHASSRGGKTIIPAFAVERTQEILHSLFLLHKEGSLPEGIPVYVDSPMAIKATKIFRKHGDFLDRQTGDYIASGDDPLSLPGLQYTLDAGASQAINARQGPAIIISASGMCNAGRIKHHLRHNLWRPDASIVFVGYQSVGTPGRKIIDGAKSISILGEDIAVAAKIFTIGGFSAHAGQSQLLEWVSRFVRPELTVFLLHGESKAQRILADLLRERFQVRVSAPAYLEELTLAPGKEPVVRADRRLASGKINWTLLLAETEGKLAQLRASLADAHDRPREEQAEIQEQILELNKRFMYVISNL